MLERREKEKRLEVRRERSPIRISRDRGGSTSAKGGRSTRRESPPRVETPHRRHSPVKEKRREYICKVYSFNLVDVERDYVSMDKRYPRLFVSPECSKVVINWSKEDLKIPFNTPVSFEHDFVEKPSTEHEITSTKTMGVDHVKVERGTTRWNAKMLLMSGLSNNAFEELSSERNYEDRIPHLCNMLRFAFLKDGSSLMAIGGSWDPVDGNDPSQDKSSLVQTVSRYAKELSGLDLKNCRHWNPFLEIHYDRVGKDGVFSHKEVTVLYVPDLSDCLPSIDAWRDQWIAHKKAIAERERLYALKKEKSREKKEGQKDKEPATPKDTKKVEKPEKKKEAGSASKSNGKGKIITEVKAKEAEKVVDKANTTEKKDGVETVNEGNTPEKKNQTVVQTPGSGKKKVIRKVIKKKVVAPKDVPASTPKKNDTTDSKNEEKAEANTEVISEDGEPQAAKTPTKKKVAKKTPVAKIVKKEDEGSIKEEEKNADVASGSDKTTVKKKVIKKVTKKKVAATKDKVVNENEVETTQVKLENTEAAPQSIISPEPQKDQVKEEKKAKVKSENVEKSEKSKDVKEKKDKDSKTESKVKEVKEVKDKKKTEEVPRHPGLFIQTKGNKDSRLRSLSLSLDSLLDYTDKDIEESTFELSLFAETFYEMLQYQMGSRILTFLQKLRIKFVAKRNQKKRQREEVSDKEKKDKTSSSTKKSSPKRLKTEDDAVESEKSVKTETLQEETPSDEKTVVKDETKMAIDDVENAKVENESEKDEEEEEEAEEDPEEDKNMADADASPKNDAETEEKAEGEKVKVEQEVTEKSENVDEKVIVDQEENSKETVNTETKSEAEEKKENPKVDTKKKEKETLVSFDKELLQAFRFFDRNRVGYIRVEDLRLILHTLGKFMSHRDVKELVQSALLESNTGRDDRILYKKLVKMTDI